MGGRVVTAEVSDTGTSSDENAFGSQGVDGDCYDDFADQECRHVRNWAIGKLIPPCGIVRVTPYTRSESPTSPHLPPENNPLSASPIKSLKASLVSIEVYHRCLDNDVDCLVYKDLVFS